MLAQTLRSTRLAVVGLFALLLAVGVFSRRAGAFNPQPDPPGYGMVGIADGQTARLNIVNLGVVDPTTGLPPDPCRAILEFVDANGRVVAARGVAAQMARAAFLDFTPNFTPLNGVAPLRAEIRAVVLTDNGVPPGPCRVTLEIFDNVTGRSQIVLAPPGLAAPGQLVQPAP
ncbi:MAG TPA: hypothetical protein VH417_06250 [Vicinamibacterales bacterium]|jgi:hypothetical protein